MDELLDPLVLIYSSRLVGIVARITDLTQLSDRTPGPQLGPAGRPWSGRSISMGWEWPDAPVVKRERLSKGREGQN